MGFILFSSSELSENYISYQTNFATLSLQTLNTLPHTLNYLLKFFTLLIGVGRLVELIILGWTIAMAACHFNKMERRQIGHQ